MALRSRRSKLEVTLNVLGAIMGGTEKPTRIMYEANLSWKILNEILSSLESQGLIERDESQLVDRRNSRAYRITRKGEAVVRYYRDAEHLIRVDEPNLRTGPSR